MSCGDPIPAEPTPPPDDTPTPTPPPLSPPGPEVFLGYGRNVTGGDAFGDYHVTHLGASGAGSYRDALSAGNRNIVFDVDGVIDLGGTNITIANKDNITIDGSTAPGDGIDVTNGSTLFVNCDNIKVRHIAYRDIYLPSDYGANIGFSGGCTGVMLDHLSTSGQFWRGIDFWDGNQDITVQWCFFGPYGGPVGGPYNSTNGYDYQMHIGRRTMRVSVDHCLFFRGSYRHPEFSYDYDGVGPAISPDTTGDMANCLIYDDLTAADHYGTVNQEGSRVNIRNSAYYMAPPYNDINRALAVGGSPRPIYLSGNIGLDGTSLATSGPTTTTPYAVDEYAVLPLDSSAQAAAAAVKGGAGRFPRDATDAAWAGAIDLGTEVATPVGFGSLVLGGDGYSEVHVTNLNNSGAGSLRQAMQGSNRKIVFDVAGTIPADTDLEFGSGVSSITIAGETAPSPGITLTGHPMRMNQGNHDIIVRQIRHRGGWEGGQAGGNFNHNYECYNILYQNCSSSGWGDGSEGWTFWGVSPSQRPHDITVMDCFSGNGSTPTHSFPMAGGKYTAPITWYRNLMYQGTYRNPVVGWNESPGDTLNPTSICGDVMNNLIWDYGGDPGLGGGEQAYGTVIYTRAWANIRSNYYYTTRHPGASGHVIEISDTGTRAYVNGNYSKDGSTFPAGTEGSPFAVPGYASITPATPASAAAYILANGGCRIGGLDTIDQTWVNQINSVGL